MKEHLSVKVASVSLILALIFPFLSINAVAITPAPPLTEDQKILHVLNRLGYGPRPGDLERVRSIGLQKYIHMQLDPASIDDNDAEARVSDLEVYGMSTSEIFAKYPNPGGVKRYLASGKKAAGNKVEPNKEPTQADKRAEQKRIREVYREYGLRPANQIIAQVNANRVRRAVYSERQLQEVMVDFWQNHFNVYKGKGAVRWYLPSYERDVLRKYALGNFKDLLIATAQHPAMLFFLDNFQSVAETGSGNNAQISRTQKMIRSGNVPPRVRERIKRNRGLTDAQLDQLIARAKQNADKAKNRPKRGINENYAREMMELHTLGVDGGYTQKDIIEVAKAFTGWTIADPRGYSDPVFAKTSDKKNEKKLKRIRRLAGVPDDLDSGEFYFNAKIHDESVKTVLGQKVHEGGMNDGLKVIDILVSNPATAKFIARKLAVKFVSDKPSEALVGRVANAFSRSEGDIKATLSALFGDPEFFAPENYRAKIKTPFELAVSAVRAIDADTNGGPAFAAMLNKLGEVPFGYQAPTGYPDTADDWVNTGALLERLNYSVALASNRIPGTRAELDEFGGTNSSEVLNKTIEGILGGEISANTRALLEKQLTQPLPVVEAPTVSDDEDELAEMQPRDRVRKRRTQLLAPSGDPDTFKVVSLVLGTPEFQRQ